jgi:hypothetical protein
MNTYTEIIKTTNCVYIWVYFLILSIDTFSLFIPSLSLSELVCFKAHKDINSNSCFILIQFQLLDWIKNLCV